MICVGRKEDFIERRAIINARIDSDSTIQRIVVLQYQNKYIALDSVCPHSSGPLQLGPVYPLDIEDLDSLVIVCPWHEYRFSCTTGKSLSDDVLQTDVFNVHLEDGNVYLELTEACTVESITFINAPRSKLDICQSALGNVRLEQTPENERLEQPPAIVTKSDTEKSLCDWAIQILNTPDPIEKVTLTQKVADLWQSGLIKHILSDLDVPERPARESCLQFKSKFKIKKLGKAGSLQSRIQILHSLGNIEQWAIDLAWDIIARFAHITILDKQNKEIRIADQIGFFDDFVRMAKEESTHFGYLSTRLTQLGSHYGALEVHDGLWEEALKTKHNLLDRLALVHMVHEARGLDVNPSTISKFRINGDLESVEKLEKIHRDEITHVATGQRWFAFICSIRAEDRYATFHNSVKKHFYGILKPPFNEKDRLQAGLDPRYYLPLSKKEVFGDSRTVQFS